MIDDKTSGFDFLASIRFNEKLKIHAADALTVDSVGMILSVETRNFDSRLDLRKVKPVYRYQFYEIPVFLLDPSSAARYFPKGTKFAIKNIDEVGEGTVISENNDEK